MLNTLALRRRIAVPELRRFFVAALVAASGFALYLICLFMPDGVDWYGAFLPASQAILRGQNPYSVSGFFSPPWILILTAPLSLLPPVQSRAAIAFISILCLAYLAHHFRASLASFVALFLSPLALGALFVGNVDALALLGVAFPPTIGLFLVLLKPQIGLGIAVFWLVEEIRDGGWRLAVKRFAPVSIALILSAVIFGDWFSKSGGLLPTPWNKAFFPYGIPVGVSLLVSAIRSRNLRLAIPSSLFLSPYVLGGSWLALLIPLLGDTPLMVLSVVGLWMGVAIVH